MNDKKLSKEDHEAMIAASWVARPLLPHLGYVGYKPINHFNLDAVAVAFIDRLRAIGRQEAKNRERELLVQTALQLIEHPIFQWCVISFGKIKVYKKRSAVAAKAASLIAHDRVLLNTGPSLPSHYGTTLTVYTACLNSAIMTPNI